MTETTERLQAVADALKGHPDVRAHDAARFIAMHDALMAHDAAQKPAEPAAAQPADPVATVREAMGRLPKHAQYFVYVSPNTPETGLEYDNNDFRAGVGIAGLEAIATILNALPALLERAEQGLPMSRVFRSGVIKGLEMAASIAMRKSDKPGGSEAFCLSRDLSVEAARIRDGGEIDGETGGTTSAEQSAGRVAPEGQTQAGGAPGMPAGWVDEGTIAYLQRIQPQHWQHAVALVTPSEMPPRDECACMLEAALAAAPTWGGKDG